jgi:hypothetical protein
MKGSPRIVTPLLFYLYTDPRAACSAEGKRRVKDRHCRNSRTDRRDDPRIGYNSDKVAALEPAAGCRHHWHAGSMPLRGGSISFGRLRRRDGDRLLQWNLPAQHLSRLVRQLEIPIAREGVAVGIERKE